LYYPELTSTGYYLTAMAEGLVDTFDVKALCGQPNYSARGVRAPTHEHYRGVEIFRCASTTFDKNILPLRLLNILTLSLATFVQAVWRFQKRDTVLVVTTPPTLPFIAAVAAVLRRADYVLLIHDCYPELLVAAGKTRATSLHARLANWANRQLYRHAKKIIVCGRDMQEVIERKTAGFTVPVRFIPNWAELEQVEPRPRAENSLLAALKLHDHFVLLYAGNMGYPNDVESLIGAATTLESQGPYHFVFLGAGVKKRRLETQIAERCLNNVTILPPRPRSEQVEFLNACDVAIVALVPQMRGVSVPSRTYNLLAAGKPILAIVDAGSEVARVIEEEQVGWIVPPNDPEALAATIVQIHGSRHALPDMGRRARAAALSKYSLTKAVTDYRHELIESGATSGPDA
jgi:glycosyltransferase involved in cell wall biosynthesis